MQYKGYLREKIELSDTNQCHHSYDFQTVQGDIIEDVIFSIDIPLNIPIEVVIENNEIVQWDYCQQPLARRDQNVKDIALIRVIEDSEISRNKTFEDVVNRYRDSLMENSRDLEHFMKMTNHGVWDYVKVTPYFVRNTTNTSRGLGFKFTDPSIQEQLKEQNPTGYESHNYWHGVGGFKSGILGLAYLNSYIAWTFSGGGRTMKHEQGHSFGCPHSTTEGDEYGDPTCIMAKSYSGFNAAQLGNMRQISQEAMLENANGCHFLASIESPEISLRDGEYKIISFKNEEGTFIISNRKTETQSILGLSDFWDGGTAFIHQVPTSGLGAHIHFGKPIYRGTIKTNNSRTIGSTTIKNDGSKDGVVRLLFNNANPKDFPEPLPPVPAKKISKSFEGIWHDPEHKYQGIDLWVIPENEQLVGYWFTHHVDDIEKRQWYVLDGKIKDGYANIDIIQTDAEGFKKKVGYGTMRFTDEGLQWRFYSETFGRDFFSLRKLTTEKEQYDLSGIWSTGKYQGYTVSKYGETFVSYYYGYENGEQIWRTYQGTDSQELTGYNPKSIYKASYGEIEKIGSLNINAITNERVL